MFKNKHCNCLRFRIKCIGNIEENNISRWLLLCMHIILAIVYVRCFFFRNVDMATATTQCCNICDHVNESKLAATWCPECEDFLCTDCDRHHARSSSSKQHIVISMENYQKLPSSIVSIKNRCNKHDNKYELYCSIHDVPCCLCA